MKINKLMIIPQKDNLTEYVALSREWGCGFEYNDFFNPSLLDDEEALEQRIQLYTMSENKPLFSTVHGTFFDVSVSSDDPKIKEVSDLRVTQSLEVAKKLDAEAVIFHTNYIPNFLVESYRDSWVKRNVDYWSKKLSEYPMLNIYVENMFDTDCELLARLGEGMKEYPNFGVCLDYAHAHVFGEEQDIEHWVSALAPYVKHLHINDNDFFRDLHLAVGDGKIDWWRFKQYYEKYFTEASVLLEVTGLSKTKHSLEYISQL